MKPYYRSMVIKFRITKFKCVAKIQHHGDFMNSIDIKISKFFNFYNDKNIKEANKVLMELRKNHLLDVKYINLIKSITSYEPSEDSKNKIRDKYQNKKFISVVNACGFLLDKTPYSLWLLHVVGLAFTKTHKFNDAFAAFERLLFLNPIHEGGLKGLANLYYETNQMKKSSEVLKKAIKHYGEDLDILNDLALAQDASQLPKDALETIEKAIAIDPNHINSNKIKGFALKNLGRLKEARDHFEKLVKKYPFDYEIKNNLAITLRDIGEYDKSETLLRSCILSSDDYTTKVKSIYTLVNFKSITISDEVTYEALALLENNELELKEKSDICFSLFIIFNKMKEFNRAFELLKMGNDLRKKSSVFSMERVVNNLNNVKNFFNFHAGLIKSYNAPVNIKNNPIPIFILGMPRSGTTLLENILSQNQNISSLGELTFLDTATKENSSVKDPHKFFDNVSKKYYELLKNYHNVKTPFFVDKMPSNFRAIGVIAKSFPDAKIIHMNRSPQAVCWSQYKTSFGSSGQDYSYSLESIAEYYNHYCDTMRFWTKLFGEQIINITYEEMVDDPKRILAPVIEQIGFEWNDEYLDYHKSNLFIKTASKDQANKPIYKGSSEEWLNYEAYLDKFKDLKRFYDN